MSEDGTMSGEFKIEYVVLGGDYTTKAYASWLNEGETARGTNKHTDTPVYVRWDNERKRWLEEDPARIIAEYVLKRMGHCEDCAMTEAFNEAADPYWLESLPPCDCAYRTVEGLFAEIEKQR